MADHAGKMAAKYGKIRDGCSHSKKPCGIAASIPVAGTMLELFAVLSRTAFFNVSQSAQMDICHICTFQMQMLQYPDTLYTLLGTGIHQGVCDISITKNIMCAVLSKDSRTTTLLCNEVVFLMLKSAKECAPSNYW